MATTTLYFTSSISGNITNANNALGDPDNTWAGNNTSFTHRWRFGTIAGGPWSPYSTQTMVLRLKKNATGGGTPVLNSVRLFDNSTDKGLIFNTNTSITSVTGQDIEITFNGSNLLSGFTNIDLEIITAQNGGGPNQRGVQIDAVTWTAQYDEVVTHIKAWSGSQWIEGKLRKWSGSQWQPAIVQRWDGTQWVNVL